MKDLSCIFSTIVAWMSVGWTWIIFGMYQSGEPKIVEVGNIFSMILITGMAIALILAHIADDLEQT